jgi:hypothetical protein
MLRFGSSLVSPHGVKPEIVLALLLVNEEFHRLGFDLIVTSLTDGVHSRQSLHDDGLAVDLRSQHLPKTIKTRLLKKMREALPPYYEVYLEDVDGPNEHFHIEYDWKGDV